jgi:hypothetical protein
MRCDGLEPARAKEIQSSTVALRIAANALPSSEKHPDGDIERLLGSARNDDVLFVDRGAATAKTAGYPRA